MQMTDIPFGLTDWSTVEPTEHPGITGKAYWRTRQFGPIRVRMVEYTPGYLADIGAKRAISCSALPAASTPNWPTAGAIR